MSTKEYYIASFCSIKNTKVIVDNKVVYSNNEKKTIKEFTKAVYKSLDIKYPKFYKMDELCKLGFLAAEALVRTTEKLDDRTALVVSNRASSLATDRVYQQSIEDKENYFPSPAVFVYTLPNIILGELSIRHQFKGENAFFVSERFDAKLLIQYSKLLLDTNKASNVICGWVDLDTNKYDVFLAIISSKGNTILTEEQLNKFYHT
ncbi:3-oxoacyl-ACP synthase [Aquimarina sp. W85]|uniref:3-oxoacyl-ACP synthase n=1 Tax=Aquimarina rhodophyticola TaxID=3342246 RepID=UPI0036702B3F